MAGKKRRVPRVTINTARTRVKLPLTGHEGATFVETRDAIYRRKSLVKGRRVVAGFYETNDRRMIFQGGILLPPIDPGGQMNTVGSVFGHSLTCNARGCPEVSYHFALLVSQVCAHVRE